MRGRALILCLILHSLAHASVQEETLRDGILNGSINLDLGRADRVAEPMRLGAFGFHMRGSPHVSVKNGRILQVGWGSWSGLNGTSLRLLEPFMPQNGLDESVAHMVLESSTSKEALFPPLAGTIFLVAGVNPARRYLGQVIAANKQALTFRWVDCQEITREDGTLQGLEAMPGEARDPAMRQLWACGVFEHALTKGKEDLAAWMTTAGLVPVAGLEAVDPICAVITSGRHGLLAPLLAASWKLGAQHVPLARQRGYRRLAMWTALNEHGLKPPAEMWTDVRSLETLPARWLALDALRHVEPGFGSTAVHAQAIRTFLMRAGVAEPGPGLANATDAVWHQRADLLGEAPLTAEALGSVTKRGLISEESFGWATQGSLIQHCFRAGAAGCLAAILRNPALQGMHPSDLPIGLTLDDLTDLAPEIRLPMLADLAALSTWNPNRLCDGEGIQSLSHHPRLVQELLTVGAYPADAAQRAVMTTALATLAVAARLPAANVLVDEGIARDSYIAAGAEERSRLLPIYLRLGTPGLLGDAAIAQDAALLSAPVLIAQAGRNLDARVLALALMSSSNRLGEPAALAAADVLMEELRGSQQVARLEPLVKAFPSLRKRIDGPWLRETAASRDTAQEDREAAHRLLKGILHQQEVDP